MYLYFDKNGTLLETINDEAYRQYNMGVNTVNVFIEDGSDIVAMKYWFKLGNGEVLQKSEYVTTTKEIKAVPFDRNRDLKHFAYGKKYLFFVIEVPCGDIKAKKVSKDCVAYVSEGNVFSQSGLILMTIQALYPENKGIPALSLDKIAFMVDDAVELPTAPVDSSEFNWLLNHYVVDNYFRPQLTYNSVIAYNGEEELRLPISDVDEQGNQWAFNRMPIVGEMFMAVYTYNNASYLGVGLIAELSTITVEEDGEEREAVNTAVVTLDSNNRVKIGNKQGDDGATFIPSVSDDGVISWTNNGGLPNPEPVDITGPIGPQGRTGATGATPDIEVTATVNNATGTPSVTVTKSGTAENPKFNLAFLNLRGYTGPQGPQGVSISSVTQTQTSTSDGGRNQITVTLSNGNKSYFYVRNGNRGSQGIQGEDALVLNTIYQVKYPEDITDEPPYVPLTKFNRAPKVGETFLLYYAVATEDDDVRVVNATVKTASIKHNDIECAICEIDFDTNYSLKGIQGNEGVGIAEIIGGEPEITPSETRTPITIKTSDSKETQVEIVAKNGMTNVVAYTVSVEPSAWHASTEYASFGYNFYATISISSDKLDYAYDTYIPTVTPTDIDDIIGDNLAPFAVSGASLDSSALGVYVYAKERPTTTKSFNVVLSHVVE